jgi:hypothetical protein
VVLSVMRRFHLEQVILRAQPKQAREVAR